jgi:two-component system chemotaxis sensor kinase CheA
LAQRAGVVAGARERALAEQPAAVAGAETERQTVLVCAIPGGGRVAIPLAAVARLEEFPQSMVERVGGRAVVQYRGDILPLVPVARLLRRTGGVGTPRRRRRGRSARGREGPVQVVVCAGADRPVGLVVGRILDLAETTIASRSRSTGPGVLFSAVIQDRVTEFLDVDQVTRLADAERAAAGLGRA